MESDLRLKLNGVNVLSGLSLWSYNDFMLIVRSVV